MSQATETSLPREVKALGTPLATHRASGAETYLEKTAWFVLAAGVVVELLLAYALFIDQPAQGKQAPAVVWALFLGGSPLVLLGFVGLARLKRRRRDGLHVRVYAHGFAAPVRGRWEFFRWDDIEAVWQKITRIILNSAHVGTEYCYTVRRRDGTQVRLTHHLNDIEELGRRVSAQVLRRLLPKALARVRAGEEVPFGPLAVGARGLRRGSHELAWADVGRVKPDAGYLEVHPTRNRPRWCRVAVESLPNLFLLLALAREALKNPGAWAAAPAASARSGGTPPTSAASPSRATAPCWPACASAPLWSGTSAASGRCGAPR